MGKTKLSWGMAAVILALALGMLLPGPADAQKTKGKTRAAETKFLMRGINQPNCGGIAAALKDKGPADDKAWEALACHASILNEMSHVVMDDGRCPDGVWAGAGKALREGSAALLGASEKKDLAAAQEAMKGVTGSCKSCHDAHKPKK
jgi:cytochrome c556